MAGSEEHLKSRGGNPIEAAFRTAEFWRRASFIYLNYKSAQLRARMLRARGRSEEDIKDTLWTPHHSWAGDQMYSLAVDLRGFYLKVFQFIGARGDFVPEPICQRLARLHDEVPPMPASQVRKILTKELGVEKLEDVFEWIDLEKPLGSASLAQVHKAQLIRPNSGICQALAVEQGRRQPDPAIHEVQKGETLFRIAKARFTTQKQLMDINPGIDPDLLYPGQLVKVPGALSGINSVLGAPSPASTAAACGAQESKDGVVAVKVQYPDASRQMSLDLGNVRAFAGFLSKTELQFDLVSAVDELADQIRLEFFFKREARIMDTIAGHLKGVQKRILIPKSVSGLVTDRVLVMNFLDGVQVTKLAEKTEGLSERARQMASRRILSRISEAYGRMLLLEGLFQADGHPGNILVLEKGRIGLLDYGQSKQLEDTHRKAFAQLVLELHRKKDADICGALSGMGVEIGSNDPRLKAKMASDMFDTTGRIDAFGEGNNLSQAPIDKFPKDLFFVLRTTQLLRGLANGMGIEDFSCVDQWVPYAKTALRRLEGIPGVIPV